MRNEEYDPNRAQNDSMQPISRKPRKTHAGGVSLKENIVDVTSYNLEKLRSPAQLFNQSLLNMETPLRSTAEKHNPKQLHLVGLLS